MPLVLSEAAVTWASGDIADGSTGNSTANHDLAVTLNSRLPGQALFQLDLTSE